MRELLRLYIHVRQLAKLADEDEDGDAADNPVMAACREETAKLHAGDPENLALWNQFMPACLAMLRPIYDRLGVRIDHAHGERFYHPMLPEIVEEMLSKKLAFESKGAMVIPNAKGIVPRTDEEQKKEEPPAILRKRDGRSRTRRATSPRSSSAESGSQTRCSTSSALRRHCTSRRCSLKRSDGVTTRSVRALQFGSMLDPKTRKMFGNARVV